MNDKQHIKLLLIESNLTEANRIKNLLSNFSEQEIDCTHVNYLQEAIDILARERFNVILLDLFLPDSDGLDTIIDLKSKGNCGISTPIVVLTGLDDEEMGLAAIKIGARDYLLKGEIDGRLLRRVLRYAIERGAIEALWRQASEELELRVAERTASLEEAIANLHQEIAEGQERESQLRNSLNLLEAVVEGTSDAIFVKNLEGRYLMLNSMTAQVLGMEVEEILGKDDTELLSAEVAHQLRSIDRRVIESGKPLSIEEVVSVGGISKTFLATKHPYRDREGNTIGVIGITRDITDRARLQQQLITPAQKLSQLIEETQGAVIEWNRDLEITAWSPAAETIFGYSEGEAIAQKIDFLVSETAREEVKQIFAEWINGRGSDRCIIYENIAKNGRKIVCEWYNSAIADTEGNFIGAASSVGKIAERSSAELELKRSEEYLEELVAERTAELRLTQIAFDRAGEAIFWIDSEANFVNVNEAACRILGYDKDELLKMGVFDIDCDLPREAWSSHWQELKAGGSFTLESHHQTKDGRIFPVEVTVNYLEFNGFEYNFTFVRDISDRKQAEEALKASEERYRSIYENTPVMLHSIDNHGNIASVSDYWLEKMGYLKSEVIGRKSVDFLTESSRRYAREVVLPEYFRTGVCQDIPYQFVKKNGEIMDVLLSATAELDLAGNVVRSLAIVVDVTELLQARKALQQALAGTQRSQSLLRTIIDASPDWIFVKNPSFRFLLANNSFASALATTPEEVLGKNDLEVGFPEEQIFGNPEKGIVGFRANDRAVFNGKLISNPFDPATTADGKLRILDTKKIPLRDENGEVYALLGFARDFTDRYEAEQQLRQKNAELQAIFDAFPDIFFRMAADGTILDYKVGKDSPRLYLTPSVFLGKRMPEVLPSTIAQQFKEALARVRQTNSSVSIEYSLPVSVSISSSVEEKAISMPISPSVGGNGVPEGEEDYECRIVPVSSEGETIAIVRNISDRKQAETALAKERSLLRCLIDSIPDFIFYKDRDGVYQICNQAFAEFIGRPESQIVGRTDFDLFSQKSAEFLQDKDFQAMAARSLQQNEEWVTYPDGSRRLLDTLKTPFLSGFFAPGEVKKGDSVGGEVLGIIGICRDITDRKEAEEAIAEQEQFLRSVYDGVEQNIFVIDVTTDGDFRYVGYNHAAESFIGKTTAQIKGKTIQEVLEIPAQVEEMRDRCQKCVDAGEPIQYEEFIVSNASGNNAWWLSSFNPLRNSEGRIYRIVGTATNISDRKGYEVALEVERQQLRQIVARAPVAMAMFDSEMRYLAYSDRWLADYNLPSESLIGQGYYNVLPDFKPEWKTAHEKGLQGEGISNSEDCWERADGTQIYQRWAIHPWYAPLSSHPVETPGNSPIDSAKQVAGIVIVSIAIDELVKAREAARSTLKLKSQFLANMSHEIRTPMNGVLGMTELLLRTQLDPQQLDFVQTLQISGENLLTIINDILDFSKLEAGEMRLDCHEFDLTSLLENLLDLFAPQTTTKGLELICAIEPDLPRQLFGDASRLRQILLNFTSNAIKFTESGEVVIEATAANAENAEITSTDFLANFPLQQGKQMQTVKLRFAVKDTGIGISPESQEKLFRSFSQVDASHTRQYGGTGLGLAICKELVQLMGGDIGVESAAGEGSTFWFTVPLGVVVTDEPKSSDSPRSESSIPLAGKKLLVVDDNPTNRKVVRIEATAWGMEVDEAAGAAIALAALRAAAIQGKPYDIALLDMQMPEITGETLALEIRSDAVVASTKLVIMTSVDDGDIATRMRDIGYQGYLVKPVKCSQLFECLTRALGGEFLAVSEGLDVSVFSPPLTLREEASFFADSDISRGKEFLLPDSQKQPATSNKNLSILLVEDTPVNQKVVLNQLQQLNYQADCANNGREALDILSDRDYDLILMDCQMPILDGYQTTEAIRQRENRFSSRSASLRAGGSEKREIDRHTVIVGLTAYAMKGDREKCIAAGMDDYLSKPVTIDELAAVLNRWFFENITDTGDREEKKDMGESFVGSLPPIDGDRLSELCGKDPEFQLEILESFVADTIMDLAEAETALAEGDAIALSQKAHRIKGASSYMAILEMPEVAASLENQAKENRLAGAADLLAGIESILERVKAYINGKANPEDSGESLSQTAPAAQASVSPLSPEAIDRLNKFCQGDRECMLEMLQAFVLDTETDLTVMLGAIAANDSDVLFDRAVQLRDNAICIGSRSIRELAKEIYSFADEEQLEEAALLLPEVEQLLGSFKAFTIQFEIVD